MTLESPSEETETNESVCKRELDLDKSELKALLWGWGDTQRADAHARLAGAAASTQHHVVPSTAGRNP